MEEKRSSFLWGLRRRFIDVIVDGLVQAAVISMVVFVLTALWAWIGHLHGAWLDRAIGAGAAALVIALVTDVTVVLREVAKSRLGHKAGATHEMGFLDYKLEAENAMGALPKIVGKLTSIMADVGPSLAKHTSNLRLATSTKNQLKVSEAASSSLDNFSARMERVRVQLETQGNSLADGLDGWSKWVENSHADRSGLTTFVDALRALIASVQLSIDKNQEYIDAMNRNKGASRILNAAIERHVNSAEMIRQANIRMLTGCIGALQRFENPPAS